MNEKDSEKSSVNTKDVEIEVDTKKNVFMFFNLKKDWNVFALGSICMSISAIGTPITTLLYGNIMGTLSEYLRNDITSYDTFINKCLKFCGILMAVGFGKFLFVWFGMSIFLKFGEIQQMRARRDVYSKLINQNIKWYDENKNIMGELIQVDRCIEELRSGNAEIMAESVQTIALILALIIMSFYQSWAITLIILASAPVMACFAWLFGGLTYRAQEEENDYSSHASKVLNWCLTSPLTVRVFNGKYVEIVKFNKYVDASAKAYFKVSNSIAANSGILKFLTLMMFVQGFWFGTFLLSHDKITINQLFTCFSSCLMLGQSISKISQLMAILNTAHAAAGGISTYLKTSEDEYNITKGILKYPTHCFGKIIFEHVQFKYPTRDELVLKDVSFKIEVGKQNYFIGKSGAGKSTIPLILMKLYDKSNGQIIIDGSEIDLLDSNWISQNITLVQQTPVVFNGTIRENIALAVADNYDSIENVPSHYIEEAAEFALLDLDLDTKITPLSLSGGQQQRLAIARAKLKDSPVLILDEAFSALDSQTKGTLINRVKAWRYGKTTITITHEYGCIDADDNVIMMENGYVKKQDKYCNYNNYEIREEASDDDDDIDEEMSEKKLNSVVQVSSINSNDQESQKDDKLLGVFAILKYCSHTIDVKAIILIGIIFSILEGIASPIFSFCFSKLLSTTLDASIGKNISKQIIQWSVISICIAFFIGSTTYISRFLLYYSSERWIVGLRKLCCKKLNGQDMSFFKEIKTAEITTLLMNDTRDLRNLVSTFLSVVVNLVAMVLVGIIWSIVAGWKLALVGLSFVPLILIITIAYGQVLQSAENKYKSSVVVNETHVHQTVSSIKTVKLFYMQNYFMQKFDEQISDLVKIGNYRAFQTGVGLAINDFITAVATGVILYFGMELTGKHQYSHGQLLQVITLLTFTLANASSLIHELPEVTRGQRAGTFIVKLLESIPYSKIENEGDVIPKTKTTEVIKIENLSFQYNDIPILKNLSLTIEKNQLIGLYGKSGSGKSTLISLLLRLFDSNSPNATKLYDQDISKINIDWLRETISIVPQFPNFFEGSIYENLIYGINPLVKINEDEIIKILKLCKIYDFVMTLPEGLYTRIGEGSNSTISGGQLQRLSIVRALIRKPKIILFDECTSNLESGFDLEFFKDIRSNFKDSTIINITHRFNTISDYDKIIILDQGEVKEFDTPENLLRDKTSIFYSMCLAADLIDFAQF
ncbi:HST6 [Candida pseudojiufengensis]|uniref:HST6 n=1 Tax=Candida pseudojiufengensis TaxID=497109 RepID=UPI0022247EB7|nr:HST6 [Candida pseudojiufengensis]KAI5965187.1 HST6 [Candida pseudojiufengensis]